MAMVWLRPIDYTGEYAHIDLAQYRAMAQAAPTLSPLVPAPFAYRLLAPYLVGLAAKGSDAYGFRIFSVACMIGVALMLFHLLRSYGSTLEHALLLCVVAFCSPYFCGFLLFNYFQATDVLGLLLTLVMFDSIRRSHVLHFAVALVLGSLTRESCMLMIPVALMSVEVGWKSTKRMQTLASVLPALGVWFVVRSTVPVSNPEWSLLSTVVDYAPSLLELEVWGRILLNTLLPLSFIPLVFLTDTRRFIREHPEWMVYVVLTLGTALIGGDRERLFAPSWIVMVLYCSELWQRHRGLSTLSMTLALLAASILCSMHFLSAQYPVPEKIFYYGCCIAAGAAIALLASSMVRRSQSTSIQRTEF